MMANPIIRPFQYREIIFRSLCTILLLQSSTHTHTYIHAHAFVRTFYIKHSSYKLSILNIFRVRLLCLHAIQAHQLRTSDLLLVFGGYVPME